MKITSLYPPVIVNPTFLKDLNPNQNHHRRLFFINISKLQLLRRTVILLVIVVEVTVTHIEEAFLRI